MKIEGDKIWKSIELGNGDKIVILASLRFLKEFSKDLSCRNLFRVNKNGDIIWQVADYKPFSNSTFTNIYQKEGRFFAYNFDGIEYEINLITGIARGNVLLK